jgi:hypothetical protein
MKPRTSDMLVDRIAADAELREQVKTDPINTLRQVSQEITTRTPRVMEADPWVYRIIVTSLALVVVISVVGVIWLATKGEEAFIPATVTALASGALGALAGILQPKGG